MSELLVPFAYDYMVKAMWVSALVGAPTGQRPVETVDAFWAPWSPEREAALRAAGTPVFVNYTAAWCLTCQVNERLVFAVCERGNERAAIDQ